MGRATTPNGLVRTSVQLPAEVLQRLERFATTLGVPTVQALRWAVLTYLDGAGDIPQPKRPG